MILEKRVIVPKESEYIWAFGGKAPKFVTRNIGYGYRGSIPLNPAPCYSLDSGIVTGYARIVEEKFPIGWDTYYYILSRELEGNVNAETHRNIYWSNKDPKEGKEGHPPPAAPFIIFSGKSIPIHPAVQRYLVAHEYGHVVNYWLEYSMKLNDGTVTKLDKQYAKMRGIKLNCDYGAKKWHENIGEIIANDFRLIICEVEEEFWPHNCDHPYMSTVNKKLKSFWTEMKEKYAV